MRRKKKRFFAGFFALLMALAAWGNSGFLSLAANRTSVTKMWAASVREVGEVPQLWPGLHHKKVQYAMIDGETAYCMNYGLRGYKGLEVTGDTRHTTELSEEQEKCLLYCLYYGFAAESEGAPGEDEACAYIATQTMVWNITGGIWGTGQDDSAAAAICASAPNPEKAMSWYATLKRQVSYACMLRVPGFAAAESEASPVYELHWSQQNQRYEIALEDDSGMLDAFDLSLSGYEVQKEQNLVTIFTKEFTAEQALATLHSDVQNIEVTGGCVYWLTGLPGYQEFVSERPYGSSVEAYFQVKLPEKGFGMVRKLDEVSGKPLAGAVYGIYADLGCTSLVETMTTDEKGQAQSNLLTAGTYYVKELTAPQGYVRKDTVYTLTVYPERTTTITATDREQLGTITICKEGEVVSAWKDNAFVYQVCRIPGAVFRLSAQEDIVRADGTRVYEKGEIIAEWLETDKDGQVTVTDLPMGIYRITEVQSPSGFVGNREPKIVKIEYGDQKAEVQYETETIYNARQQVQILVKKKDAEDKKPLEGAIYGLYAAEDILGIGGAVIVKKGTELGQTVTDKDGSGIFEMLLPQGSYCVRELQAPPGYEKTDEIVMVEAFWQAQGEPVLEFLAEFENMPIKEEPPKTGETSEPGRFAAIWLCSIVCITCGRRLKKRWR